MSKIVVKSISFIFLFSLELLAQGLHLRSHDLQSQASNTQVFNGFGCTGSNMSPQLSWENPPKNTKSFAITVYDKDANTGSGWWHWLVFDIPKDIQTIHTNASQSPSFVKQGIQSKTDFSQFYYGGFCPPRGDTVHTYITTLYALDVSSLHLSKESNPALVGYKINQHTLEKSSLITYYKRGIHD